MHQTCLVTGGAGFIGCALSHRLAEKFERYVVLDSLHPQVHALRERPKALHAKAELVVGDITQPAVWDALLEDFRPDVVVHLAAETGTGQSLTESSRHAKVNVVGTTQMLDAFSRTKILPVHLVLASSRAVYGEGAWQAGSGASFYPGQRSNQQLSSAQWDFPDAHSLPSRAIVTLPSPTNVYAATKLAQEHILRSWAQSFGAACSILRLQNVYGPGQSLINSYTGIVALFSRLAKAGQSISLYEDGAMTRDFVFINDVADAMALAVNKTPATFRVLDIGSGRPTTIMKIAHIIASIYSAPSPHVCGKFRDGDVRHASCDISDAIADLGCQPHWSIEDGLLALKDWIDEKL